MKRKSRIRSGYDLVLAKLLASERASRGNVGVRPDAVKKRKLSLKNVVVLIAIVLTLTSAFWLYRDDSWQSSVGSSSGASRAAIIDQLSGTVPDLWFVNTTVSTLRDAGYTVDYYSPAQVTVALFQSIPLKGYNLIVIRSHSGGEG